MNVLQVNTAYPYGSTGRIAAEIATYAAAQPDTHMLIAFGIGQPVNEDNITAVRIGSAAERKIHAVIRKLLDAEGYGSWFATGELIRLCETQHIDVVHLHNLHGCYINLSRWFAWLAQKSIPVIWTLHDCWPMTGHCAFVDYDSCAKWKTQCRQCPNQREYPTCIGLDGSARNHRLKRKLFTGLNRLTIVTPCLWMQNIVDASFWHGTPVRVIYNGVDTAKFKPTASDIRQQYGVSDKRLLLSVASDWDRRKGLDYLIKLPQLLGDSYRVVILGLTKEQIAALPDGLLGLERTASQAELAAWYSAADCFVNPTISDTMPLVNLEALACGTPIAVFNTGGCPEVITDTCGIVAEKGNAKALADAVKRICEADTDYTDACVAQAQRFNTASMVRAYHALYREVLK